MTALPAKASAAKKADECGVRDRHELPVHGLNARRSAKTAAVNEKSRFILLPIMQEKATL